MGLIPAEELAPGDFVHLQIGDLVPADIAVREEEVLIDQSALTGESAPIEVDQGKTAHAGSLVKRGEASGEVTATGQRTYFGKTAELVRSAETLIISPTEAARGTPHATGTGRAAQHGEFVYA